MTNAPIPIEAFFDGDVFKPINAWWTARARKQFVVGEVYKIVDEPERSSRSHAHYFARIQDVWESLPTLQAERFKSPEHLRRWALIQGGYSNSHSMPCGSPSAARKFAAFVKPIDEFAVVTVEGSVVSIHTAKSQNYRSMDKKTFQESKTKVLEIIADLIGTTAKELSAPTAAEYMAAG
jgi:hypothetical protein